MESVGCPDGPDPNGGGGDCASCEPTADLDFDTDGDDAAPWDFGGRCTTRWSSGAAWIRPASAPTTTPIAAFAMVRHLDAGHGILQKK